jgi:uncharacterized lipoprotein YmbA
MFSLAATLLLAACIRGTLPARELYRLAPPDSMVGGASASDTTATGGGAGAIVRPALEGTLAVMPYETPGLYGENGIVYRVGETEYGIYPSREWAIPLGDMLGHLTARMAGRTSLTRELPIFDPASPRSHAWLWRARVREFEEVNRGRELLVAVRLEATIVRARDDSVIWSGSAARERAVTDGADMPAVVRTLSAAAASAVGELLARAERDLARPGASSAAGAAAGAAAAAAPARRAP